MRGRAGCTARHCRAAPGGKVGPLPLAKFLGREKDVWRTYAHGVLFDALMELFVKGNVDDLTVDWSYDSSD